MTETETTRVSSRGQVVIPQAVREAIQLREGELLAVFGKDDTIVLKRVKIPAIEELERIAAPFRAYAKAKGLTRKDVDQAIREVRDEDRARRERPRKRAPMDRK